MSFSMVGEWLVGGGKNKAKQDLVFSVKIQFGNLCFKKILGPKHFFCFKAVWIKNLYYFQEKF